MFAFFTIGGGEILLLLMLLFLVPLSLACLAFWIWMLVDAAKNPGLDQNERIVWVVVIALTHCIGALIYLCVARSKCRTALPPRTA